MRAEPRMSRPARGSRAFWFFCLLIGLTSLFWMALDMRGSAPIAGQNRTDTSTNAQDPMADRLEMRMKREGHDM